MNITQCMQAGFTNTYNEEPLILTTALVAATAIMFVAISAFNTLRSTGEHHRIFRNQIAESSKALQLLYSSEKEKYEKKGISEKAMAHKIITLEYATHNETHSMVVNAMKRTIYVVFGVGVPVALSSWFMYRAGCNPISQL